MIKSGLLWLFLLLSLGLGYWTYESIEYQSTEQNLTQRLEVNITNGYLDRHIIQASKLENFDDVKMYEELAAFLDINLSSETKEEIRKHSGTLETTLRNIKAFGLGFAKGNSDSVAGMSGSIASDMTLYGDLRDLKKEGSLYIDDKPYDTFILNISLIGVGLSASQLLSAGASTPLKVGASVLKVAKKTGKISKPFAKVLSKRLSKTVDIKVLKQLEFTNIFKLKSTAKTIEKSIDLTPVKVLFKDVEVIESHTSLTDTISLMKYIDTPKDLKAIGKISSKFGKNTKAVMKVLGKGALRTEKSIVKWSTKFLYQVVGFVLSILGFVSMLFIKWWSFRRLRGNAS